MKEEQMIVACTQDQIFIGLPPPPPLGSISMSSLASVSKVWQIKMNFSFTVYHIRYVVYF